MEASAKYRSIACTCLIVATLSAFGRWQLLHSGTKRSQVTREATYAQVFKQEPTPRLPAPNFLRFDSTPLSSGGGLDLADDGSLLTVSFSEQSQTRTYRYQAPFGNKKEFQPKTPEERYSMSQGGRLLKFYVDPPTPGQFSIGQNRRGGPRLGIDQLLSTSGGQLVSNRRFLNDGTAVRFVYGAKLPAFLTLAKQGAQPVTIFETLNQFSLAEIDDDENIWIWEDLSRGQHKEIAIHAGSQNGATRVELPQFTGFPKYFTTTNQRSYLTIRTPNPEPRHRAYEFANGQWKELLPPQGFHSIFIQRVTEDGLMFGCLQADTLNLVPTVWKDGLAYDLRRHPLWPIGGERSYIEMVNRRGDLIASSLEPNGGYTLDSTLLRRSVAK